MGRAGRHLVCDIRVLSPWEPCMFGRSLAGAWPLLMSGLSPSPFFICSLDLSELAKAAKKKLQAVSLLTQACDT